MKRFLLIAAATLAACSARTDSQADDEKAAANVTAASRGEVPPATEPQMASAAPDREIVSEAPFTADSAQGAANVVQTYFALLEAKKYSDAHKLWGPGSDLADGTFAATFVGYREYHAEVYAPGEIEGAAGSLYVEVPVKVYGVTSQGEKFEEPQIVTLRRVNNVDGSTAEQRRWHIARVDRPPGPH